MNLEYCFEKIVYNTDLINGDYQSSILFVFVDEIKSSLYRRHHLVGLISILCLIEITGREILKFKKPNKTFNNTECFNYFLMHYLNYKEELKSDPKLYDKLRNGMVHEGFPKKGSFGTGFIKKSLKPRGITNKEDLHVTLDILLHEYLEGLLKFRQEEVENNWQIS